MSKKRKTKKEKIAAASRQTVLKIQNSSEEFSHVSIMVPEYKETETQRPHTSHNYSYVVKDIRKTLMITLFLIALDIAIFFILKLGIVKIADIAF